MIDIIALARGRLGDPLILDWALDRYDGARHLVPSPRDAMLRDWFSGFSLRRIVRSAEADQLLRLFSTLPADAFAPLAKDLAERLPSWDGHLRFHGSILLARVDAEAAKANFLSLKDLSELDPLALGGIARGLALTGGDGAGALLGRVVHQLSRPLSRRSPWNEVALVEAFGAAIEVEPALVPGIADVLLECTDRLRAWEAMLVQAAEALANTELLTFCARRREGDLGIGFGDLAPLFDAASPLADLDRASRPDFDDEAALVLLEGRLEPDRIDLIEALFHRYRARGPEGQEGRFRDLVLATAAASWLRPVEQLEAIPAEELLGLLSLDTPELPFADLLQQRLIGLSGEQAFGARLAEAFAGRAGDHAGRSLAPVLAAVRGADAIESLLAAINFDTSYVLWDAVTRALECIGSAAQSHLIEHWAVLDEIQRHHALIVIAAIGGEAAAHFAERCEEEIIAVDVESWCALCAAAPDARLVDRLAAHLDGNQFAIERAFYQSATLLEVEHPRREQIGTRVASEIKARREALDGSLREFEQLSLALRCPECGETHRYDVHRVAVGDLGRDDQILLAEELQCQACGAWSDLQLTPQVFAAVNAELHSYAAGIDAGLASSTELLVRLRLPFEGQILPVAALISLLRQRLEVEGESPSLLVWLGYCYHSVLKRPRAGLVYAEHALEHDALAVEATLQRADALAQLGRTAEAFELLDGALAERERWRLFLTDVYPRAAFSANFAALYNDLLGELGRRDRAALLGGFLGA